MELEDITEGKIFYGVLGKLVRDHDGNRKRVISIPGQIIPAGIYIECSKSVREKNVIGTMFKINVGVSKKPVGIIYLHSLKKLELLTVDEWEQRYGGLALRKS